MLKEFKEFVAKGNVVGLAVAVVMGAAFGVVVKSFTDDLLMQLIAAIGAKPDFDDLVFTVNATPIRYGSFLTAVVSFLIISLAVFLVVRAYNRFVRSKRESTASETDLLREIRDLLKAQGREQLPH